ncbi:MAG: phosphoribosylanthranilate isomerase [Coriobacteriia bacterium]|nr:phosphoribosylanthranilate isomerase [Coriobacteriia bacterium]
MSRRTRIKICGITRAEDAALAVAAGADAIGVVFAPSPRQVDVLRAAEIFSAVPPAVERVGVFVNAPAEEVARAVTLCGLSAVQFSGDESPENCAVAPASVVKAFRVGTEFDTAQLEPYRGHVDALLLDTYVAGQAGGTSQTFSWHTIGELPGWAPFYVAGGLNAGNVGECIAALHPFAVDVSSGVESSPGVKDPEKVRALCAAVRAADRKEESR